MATEPTGNDQDYALAEFPDFVVIDTTYRCNVICGMCHLNNKDFKIPEVPHISLELIERMIPLLRKSRSVFLLGRGEPLMHPKIYDIIGLIRAECPGIFITFVTNGVLLTKRNIEKLLDLNLNQIHVSVDGPDIERGHPRFERVKANLRDLARQKRQRGVDNPAIHFNYVIGKDNEMALRPTLDFGVEIGLEGIGVEPLRIIEPMPEWDGYINDNNIYKHLDTVVPIMDEVRTVAAENGIKIESIVPTRLDLDRLNDTLKANRKHRRPADNGDWGHAHVTPDSLKCDRPFKMLRVEMDGSVFMCPAALPADLNAFTTEPIEIWNSPRFREVRCRLTEENFDAVCLDCHKLRNRLVFDAEIARKTIEPERLSLTADGLLDATRQAVAINESIQGRIERCAVEGGKILVKGWAADMKARRPCLFAVVFINGANFAVAQPILRRPDVATGLGTETIEMCGFTILADYADAPGDVDLQLWAIDQSGAAAKLSRTRDFVLARPLAPEATLVPM
jgi:MoaA/NifB/PqqE/SkfB family radical SAM enzyme